MSDPGRIFYPKIRIIWAILSILCLLYSAMIYMVGSGTFSFVIWLAGSAFFFICFFLAGKNRWSNVSKPLRYAAYIFIGLILIIFIACQCAILSHFGDKGEKNLDFIIVLGAQMRDSGPSVIYRYRLEKAAEYLRDNPDTVCIVTGGNGDNESISEGEGGALYLHDSFGIPASRIIVENTSLDTSGNIKNALLILKEQGIDTDNISIGIVTNGFHVYRGVSIARKNSDADICGIAAYMLPQYIPNHMVRECFGIIRDKFYGRM